MDSKQFLQGFKEADKRLDWQGVEIRKVPTEQIELLNSEYDELVGGSINVNPNLRAEFVINEFSFRNGNGKRFHSPEREEIVYLR